MQDGSGVCLSRRRSAALLGAVTKPKLYWVIHLSRSGSPNGWYGGADPQITTALPSDLSEALRFDDHEAAQRQADQLRDQGAADHVDVFEFLTDEPGETHAMMI